MVRKIIILLLIIINCQVFANDADSDTDKHVKTGLTFGALPAIAFDSDIGFKYGALANFYLYGDGSTYPKYLHSFFVEYHRTTKGSGLMQFVYDSEFLIPNIRVTAEVSYFTEQALAFYGFNGYRALYNPDFEIKTGMFYRHERSVLRLRADFQGSIIGRRLRWLAGFEHNGFDIADVNFKKLDKPIEETLYKMYCDWSIIKPEEKNGGKHNTFKLGLVYDTRDNEPNPMSGMWSEILLFSAPSFMGDKGYTKLAITHRQYFTLVDEVLNLAARVSYQPKISGEIPFYVLPHVYSTSTNILRDGLGGAKSMRGILRNRIVGDDMLFGNVELRWKFFNKVVGKQHLYFAFTPFTDFGMVTREYKFSIVPPENPPVGVPDLWWLDTSSKEKMHFSYGAGISGALNHNFVAHVNYGRAADPRDGTSGTYIGLNFLF